MTSDLYHINFWATAEMCSLLQVVRNEKNLNRSQAIEMCLRAGMTSLRIVKRGHKFDQKSKAGQPKKAILKRLKTEISTKPD